MNREELKVILNKAGKYYVNIYGLKAYSKHGLERALDDDQYVLDKERTKWIVYFYEKGQNIDQKTFDGEGEACRYLLKWITES